MREKNRRNPIRRYTMTKELVYIYRGVKYVKTIQA